MGNLKGFYSHNLQKLFYRSPNYRKTELADYQKAIKNIITGIKSCIQSQFDKQDVSASSISEWRVVVISAIAERTGFLSPKIKKQKSKNILKF